MRVVGVRPAPGSPRDSAVDWDAIRTAEFPVAERWAYFDHAAVAPLPRRSGAMIRALVIADADAGSEVDAVGAQMVGFIAAASHEPGTTATDMTAAFGIGRSVTESAKTVVRLATLGADGPTGTFTDEHGELGW